MLEEFYLSLRETQDALQTAETGARRSKDTQKLMQISAQRNKIQAILEGQPMLDPLEQAILAGGEAKEKAWAEFVAKERAAIAAYDARQAAKKRR